MRDLIDDLLAYSRAGARGNAPAPTDCNEALERALTNLSVAIRESGAVITKDPLPTVMGDLTQITQVLQNLLSNAIKFRGARIPEIHVGAERNDGAWLFSVRDNGIGMEATYSERIFRVFQRLHTRREYAGTGIGLAICKKIIEHHGGRVWVTSQPGQGSTFYFTVPERR
jgi:light-regulated signal transduction histidine kinase (bacteriophytochrome)